MKSPNSFEERTQNRDFLSQNDCSSESNESLIELAPQGTTEISLAKVWRQLLGVENIRRSDHFFYLGGTSLMAAQLLHNVRQLFGVEVSLPALLRDATLEGMSNVIAASSHLHIPEKMPIHYVSDEDSGPISWQQYERLSLQVKSPTFGRPYLRVIELAGELDVDKLSHAFNQLAIRHKILRTNFLFCDAEYKQIIHSNWNSALITHDLRNTPPEIRGSEIEKVIDKLRRRSSDISKDPLFVAELIRTQSSSYLLLISLHTLIIDAPSVDMLLYELGDTYNSLVEGRETEALPSLPIQYIDYCRWERSEIQGTVLEKYIDYWEQHVSGCSAGKVNRQPDEHLPNAVGTTSFASISIPLELANHVRQFCRAHNITLFMTVFAAFLVMMTRHTGKKDLLVSYLVSDRQYPETIHLLGPFVNFVAVRCNVSQTPPPRFIDLLKEVQTHISAANYYQALPFSIVKSHLEDRGHCLDVEAIFNFLDTSTANNRDMLLNNVSIKHQYQPPGDNDTITSTPMLYCCDNGTSINLHLKYAPYWIEDHRAKDFMESLVKLLAQLIENPTIRVS